MPIDRSALGGISVQAVAAIRNVLAAHPSVTQAVLFGSRAKGNYKNGSDIDLAIFGPCSDSELGTIALELDDLLLPWEIDLIRFDSITNTELRENIVRTGIPFTPIKPSVALARHRKAICALASRFKTTNPRIFGSVVHGQDTNGSDLDILVDALPGATLFDLGGLQIELEDLLGVRVDLLTPGDLPPKFRTQVIAEARPV